MSKAVGSPDVPANLDSLWQPINLGVNGNVDLVALKLDDWKAVKATYRTFIPRLQKLKAALRKIEFIADVERPSPRLIAILDVVRAALKGK